MKVFFVRLFPKASLAVSWGRFLVLCWASTVCCPCWAGLRRNNVTLPRAPLGYGKVAWDLGTCGKICKKDNFCGFWVNLMANLSCKENPGRGSYPKMTVFQGRCKRWSRIIYSDVCYYHVVVTLAWMWCHFKQSPRNGTMKKADNEQVTLWAVSNNLMKIHQRCSEVMMIKDTELLYSLLV